MTPGSRLPGPARPRRWWSVRARIAAAALATWIIAGLASLNLLAYPTEGLGLVLGGLSLLAWAVTVVLAMATLARTNWHISGAERTRSAVVTAAGGLAVAGAAVFLVAAWVSFQHANLGP